MLADVPGLGLARLAPVYEQGVRDGVFRPDMDMRMVALSVSSLCLGLLLRREMLREGWDQDLRRPEVRQALEDHVVGLVLDGVRARRER
jgi:hypothetical protein